MRDFFRLFIFFIFILFNNPASSGLTLTQALEMAENHPVLKLHEMTIHGRQYEVMDASARGPTGVSITTENFGGDTGLDALETTLEVSLPLQNSRRVRARKKLAEAQVNLSRLEKATARWLILSQTSRAFHRALVMKDLADEAGENIENAEKLLEVSKIMVESGAVAEQEIFQAELVLKQARLDLRALQGSLEDAKADLITAMGLESITELEIIGSTTAELELPTIGELEKIIFSSHPEVTGKKIESDRTQAKLDVIRAENTPSWNLVAGARNIGETGTNDFLIGIEAEIPRARDNLGERTALKKDIERLALEKMNTERELRLKLHGALNKFKRLQDQIRQLRDEILPGAYNLFELSITGYQLGKTDQIVVLQAQKEFLDQKQNYLQRLDELYEAANSIESLAGYSGTYSFSSSTAN